MTQTGKISWFGGPNDPSAQGTPASGIPITTPGIAVYNRQTLGGWWLLRLPNNKLTLIQQTDIGPAPSTGRTFDFTYSALKSLGYSEGNFPTNSAASGVYLGKTKPQIQSSILAAAQSLGANLPNISGWINLVSAKPTFGVTTASGNMLGPISTGAFDTGNQAVQPQGPATPSDALGAIGTFFSNLWHPLRILYFIAGLVLGFLGLRQLAGVAGAKV
ncbi:MAG TPA: hypothetical protein VFP55_13680 [Solirubrobacteraceae bacterium]|nr:hypothetical protein [Solirubrobacteraceae bacterium]